MTSEVMRLSYGYCKNNLIFVKTDHGNSVLTVTRSTDPSVIMEVQRYHKQFFRLEKIEESVFEEQLNKQYQKGHSGGDALDAHVVDQDLDMLAEQTASSDLLEHDASPLINFINAILLDAINHNASDIHIEHGQNRLVIRYRIDGLLRKVATPRADIGPSLISRLKILSKLDIAEKRAPQDGRTTLRVAGRDIDVRVSTLPTQQLERVVLRILNKQSNLVDLERLGLPDVIKKQLKNCLEQNHGIILVTGPTGSGKTTTLYACLQQINSEERNILTLEDPVEYQLDGIGQTQYNPKAGLTFAKGLKAILRQDPDIIMIGEIRDSETLDIALQASLTGHLVLSTLHTNSASGAVTRLLDMGAEPFLIRSTVRAVVAQRLVRKLCEECKQAVSAKILEEYQDYLKLRIDTAYQANGCGHCNHSGYTGRVGVYEMLQLNSEMRSLVKANASEDELYQLQMRDRNLMFFDGVQKVQQGITSLEEVMRVTPANQALT